TFLIDSLSSWTELPLTEAKVNMGTGCYRVNFTLPNLKADNWMLDLGDVRESARIRINGQEIGTLWSVPFTAMVGKNLKAGNNLLEVEVTNLPANRIADYDRRKVDWRIFKEINMVDLNYKKVDYGSWSIVPSGLLGPVKLIPMNNRAK
ncbi:MAG: glycosyl hydrolase family 2, partial [Bacteroides sp.]